MARAPRLHKAPRRKPRGLKRRRVRFETLEERHLLSNTPLLASWADSQLPQANWAEPNSGSQDLGSDHAVGPQQDAFSNVQDTAQGQELAAATATNAETISVFQGDIVIIDLGQGNGDTFTAVDLHTNTGGTFLFSNGDKVEATHANTAFDGLLYFIPNTTTTGAFSSQVLRNGVSETVDIQIDEGYSTTGGARQVPLVTLATGFNVDTLRTQQRLKHLGYRSSTGGELVVDGKLGNNTRHAIGVFNGVVTPPHSNHTNQDTIDRWINHPDAPAWVEIVPNTGFQIFRGTNQTERWGAIWAQEFLDAVGADWAAHPEFNSNFIMSAVSLQAGGDTPFHATHELGMDIDFDTPSTDSTDVPFFATYTHGGIRYVAGANNTVLVSDQAGGYMAVTPASLGGNFSNALPLETAYVSESILNAIRDLIVDPPGYSTSRMRAQLEIISNYIENPLPSGTTVQRILYNDPRTWDIPGVQFSAGHAGHSHVDIVAPDYAEPSEILTAEQLAAFTEGLQSLDELLDTMDHGAANPLAAALPFVGYFDYGTSSLAPEVIAELEADLDELVGGIGTAVDTAFLQPLLTHLQGGGATTVSILETINGLSSQAFEDGYSVSFASPPESTVLDGVVSYSLDLRIDRSFDSPVSLGGMADDQNLVASGTLPVQTALELPITIGVDTNAPSANGQFFVSFNDNARVSATLDDASAPIDLRVGILGTDITNGTLDLNAEVVLSHSGTQIFSGDFTTSSLGSDLTVVSQSSNAVANLPMDVSLGSWVPLGSRNYSVASYDPLSGQLPSVQLTGINDLNPFRALQPGSLIGIFESISGWFDSAADSSAMNFAAPFVRDQSVADTLDYAQLITDVLIAPLQTSVEGQPPVAAFDTIEDFGTLLSTSQGVSLADLGLDYDPATSELSFTLDLPKNFGAIEAPIDFDAELGDLDIDFSGALVSLDASGSLQLSVGILLTPLTVEVASESNLPSAGIMISEASFGLRRNNGTAVQIVVPADTGNTSEQDLVDDVNTALGQSSLAGLVIASLGPNDNLVLSSTGLGTSVSLEIESPNEFASTLLGLTDGLSASNSLLDQVFIENANLSGLVNLSAPDINGAGSISVVDVGFGSGSLSGQVGVSGSINGGARVSLSEMIDSLDDPNTNLFGVDVTAVASASLNEIEVIVDGFTPLAGTPSLTVDFTLENGTPTFDVTTNADLSILDNLEAVTTEIIVDALQDAQAWLAESETLGVLNESLPLVDQSISEMLTSAGVSPSQLIDDLIARIESFEIKTLNEIDQAATQWLQDRGLPGTFQSSFDSGLLQFTIELESSFAAQVAADIDVNLTEVGVSTDLASVVDFAASGAIGVSGVTNLTLTAGVDATNPLSPSLFIGDSTGLSVALEVQNTDPLNFEAALGPIGIYVVDGSVRVDDGDSGPAQISLGLQPDAVDGRYTLAELTGNTSLVAATIDASGSVNLPLAFPTVEDSLGTLDIAADIAVSGTDLVTTETVTGPDLGSFFSSSEWLQKLNVVDAGWEGMWTLIETVVDSQVLSQDLPLVGDGLQDAADFLVKAKTSFLEYVDNFGDRTLTTIQGALYDVFGSEDRGGIGWLKDINNDGQVSIEDIQIDTATDPNAVQFNLLLGQDVMNSGQTELDLALPGLGLDIDGMADVKAGFDMAVGFGVSLFDGVYLDVSAQDELTVNVEASVPGLAANAELGFLNFNVTDLGSTLTGQFTVDLHEPTGTSDGRLTLAEIADRKIDHADLVTFTYNATADIDLGLETNLANDAALPSLSSDLAIDWVLSHDTPLSTPTVAFNDVQIDVGTFLSQFMTPILERVNTTIEPLQPVIDTLNTEIEFFSQLEGKPVRLIDLVAEFASDSTQDQDKLTKFFDAVSNITSLLSQVPEVTDGQVKLNLGSFEVSGESAKEDSDDPPVIENPAPEAVSFDTLPSATGNFLDSVTGIEGLTIPILNDPITAFGLLIGDDVDLFQYDLPELSFDLSYEKTFPIPAIPVLQVGLAGDLSGVLDLAFGYDTRGLNQYLDTRRVADIFKGFYVSDTATADGTGDDVPEVSLQGSIVAIGELDVILAAAGVEGGLFADLTLDLEDPNDDGRVYTDEFIALANESLLKSFVIEGGVKAGLTAFAEVGFLGQTIASYEYLIAEQELIEFDFGVEGESFGSKDEPNENAASAFPLATLPVGGSLTLDGVQLASSQDRDWYSFDVTEDRQLDVQINYDRTRTDLQLEIYDTAGNLLARAADNAEGIQRIEDLQLTAGSYLLYVYGNGVRSDYSVNIGFGGDTIVVDPNVGQTLVEGLEQLPDLFGNIGSDENFSNDLPLTGESVDQVLSPGAMVDHFFVEPTIDAIEGNPDPSDSHAINFDFIRLQEGFETRGYVPNNNGTVIGVSGVTIAVGFDLGQHDLTYLNNTGWSQSLIDRLTPYLGIQGQDALALLEDNPLRVSVSEAEQIAHTVHESQAQNVINDYETATGQSFASLPEPVQTVAASVSFQYGSLPNRTPTFWGYITSNNWDGAIAELRNFGDDFGTRRNREADYLENGLEELANQEQGNSNPNGLSQASAIALATDNTLDVAQIAAAIEALDYQSEDIVVDITVKESGEFSTADGDEIRFNVLMTVTQIDEAPVDLDAQLTEAFKFNLDTLVETRTTTTLDFSFGANVTNATPDDDFFFRLHQYDVQTDFDLDDIDADLRVGFLDVSVVDGSAALSAGLSMSLTDGVGTAIDQLNLATINGLASDAVIFSITPTGSIDVNLPIRGGLGGWNLPVTANIELFSDDVFSGEGLEYRFSADFLPVLDFLNIGPEVIVGLLQNVADWFVRNGDSDFLDVPLPFADDLSLNELIGIGESITDELTKPLQVEVEGNTEFLEPIFSSIQEFAEDLSNLLGNTIGDLNMNYDPLTKELTFRVDYTAEASTTVTTPINLDLVTSDLDLSSVGSDIDLMAAGEFGFTLGVALTPIVARIEGDQSLPENGQLSGPATFSLSINAAEPLVLTVPVDATNTSAQDIVDQINEQLVAADAPENLSAQLTAEGRLALELTGPATDLSIVIVDGDDELGLLATAIDTATIFDSAFIRNAEFMASATIDGNPINASARYGFVDLIVNSGVVDADAFFSIELNDLQGTPGGRINFSELDQRFIQDPSNLITLNTGGSALIDFSDIRVVDNVLGVIEGNPTLQVNWPDIFDLSTLDTNFNLDFQPIDNLGGITRSVLITQLEDLQEWLEGAEEEGPLSAEIPLVNKSVSELINPADAIGDLIDLINEEKPNSLQDYKAVLGQWLGVEAQDLADVANSLLSFQVTVGESFSEELPIDLEGDLSSLGLPSEVDSLLQIGGQGIVQASGGYDLVLEFGIDITNPANPIPYISDNTRLDANLQVASENLDFQVALGPLGLFVNDASVFIDDGNTSAPDGPGPATFSVYLAPDTVDHRYSLAEALGSFQAEATGRIDAALPLYFPTIDSPVSSAGPTGNRVELQVQDLGDILGTTTIVGPNLQDLIDSIDLNSSLDILNGGWDSFWSSLDLIVTNSAFVTKLPLIGDGLVEAADFLRNVRDSFNTKIDSLSDFGTAAVRLGLFEVFGPDQLNLLKDITGDGQVTIDDVQLIINNDFVQYNFDLEKILSQSLYDIGFDLGLPALGLEVDGGINLQTGFSMSVGLGVHRTHGLYVDTSKEDEIEFLFEATIPGLQATGRLGFLEAIVSDNPDDPSRFVGGISVDLVDPTPSSDNRLTLPQLGGGLFSGAVDVSFDALADINLIIDTGVVGATGLPRLVTDLLVDWEFNGSDGLGSSPDLRFENVRMDLGSFMSDLVGPLLGEVQEALEPIQPVIDFLTYEIPVIDWTFVDLARAFGYERAADFLDAAVTIVDLANSVPVVGDSVFVELGDFDLGGIDLRFADEQDVEDADPIQTRTTDGARTQINTLSDDANDFLGLSENVGGNALQFPLLESPALAFRLLLGQDVDIFLYDMPELAIGASVRIPLPVPPPLTAALVGGVSAGIDLAFGYDTRGVRLAVETGDLTDILKGFYFDERSENGMDINEVFFRAYLGAQAGLGISGIIEGGVRGALQGEIGLDLRDPNENGKVHVDEFLDAINDHFFCAFQVNGSVDFVVSWYIDTLFGGTDGTIANIELIDVEDIWASNGCDHEPLPDRFEFNDTILDAAPIGLAPGINITGTSISLPTDVDWYTFEVLETSSLDVAVEYDPTQAAIETVVFDENNVQVVGRRQTGSSRVTLAPGVYTMRVTADGRAAAYDLSINQAPNDSGRVFFVNPTGVSDPTVNSYYTLAAGNDANDGLTPQTPVATLSRLVELYALAPEDTVVIDSGTYATTNATTSLDAGAVIAGAPGGTILDTSTGAILIDDVNNTAFYGLTFQGGTTALHVQGDGISDADGTWIRSSQFLGQTGQAVIVDSSGSTTISGNLFDGQNLSGTGLRINSTGSGEATENIFQNYLVGVSSDSLATVIHGNDFLSNATGFYGSGSVGPVDVFTQSFNTFSANPIGIDINGNAVARNNVVRDSATVALRATDDAQLLNNVITTIDTAAVTGIEASGSAYAFDNSINGNVTTALLLSGSAIADETKVDSTAIDTGIRASGSAIASNSEFDVTTIGDFVIATDSAQITTNILQTTGNASHAFTLSSQAVASGNQVTIGDTITSVMSLSDSAQAIDNLIEAIVVDQYGVSATSDAVLRGNDFDVTVEIDRWMILSDRVLAQQNTLDVEGFVNTFGIDASQLAMLLENRITVEGSIPEGYVLRDNVQAIDNLLSAQNTNIGFYADNDVLLQQNSVSSAGGMGIRALANVTLESNTVTNPDQFTVLDTGLRLTESVAASNNIVSNATTGIYAFDDVTLNSNQLTDNDVGIVAADRVALTLNTITGGSTGIVAVDSVTIHNNEVRQATTGIDMAGQVSLLQNNVHSNTTGVVSALNLPIGPESWDPGLENLIHDNTTGIVLNTPIELRFNKIYSNEIGVSIAPSANGSWLHHNLIYRNQTASVEASSASGLQIVNNTMFTETGDNIRLMGGSHDALLRNNILWTGGGYDIYVAEGATDGFNSDYNNLYSTGSGQLIYYKKPFDDILDIQIEAHFDTNSIGYTRIDPQYDNPLFIDLAEDDYHLTDVTSTSVGAGDPTYDFSIETLNGSTSGRINLGAYGNTSQAALGRANFVELIYPDFYTDLEINNGKFITWRTYDETTPDLQLDGNVDLDLYEVVGQNLVKVLDIATVPARDNAVLWTVDSSDVAADLDRTYKVIINHVENAANTDTAREYLTIVPDTTEFYVDDRFETGDTFSPGGRGDNRKHGQTSERAERNPLCGNAELRS